MSSRQVDDVVLYDKKQRAKETLHLEVKQSEMRSGLKLGRGASNEGVGGAGHGQGEHAAGKEGVAGAEQGDDGNVRRFNSLLLITA